MMTTHTIKTVIKILQRETAQWGTPIVTEIQRRTNSPYQVLISCLLSLRTKDAVTAQASKRLFALADTPQKMQGLSIEQIEKAIYPVGFYHHKAQQMIDISKTLLADDAGRVPDTLEALLALKGVGRKTANLVISVGYGKPGICVDTHVHRICNRWGYVKTKNPEETEMALREKLPAIYWGAINDLLVTYGQNRCKPISPLCSECPLASYCEKVGVAHQR